MFSMGAGYRNYTPYSPPTPTNHTMVDSSAAPAGGHGDELGHNFVHVAEAVIQPVILGLGIVTNVLSLVILRKMHMGVVLKVCITSLTLSDLCASIFGFSQIVLEVAAFNGNIPFGYYHPEAIASHVLYFLFMAFMCTSSGLVILIVVIRSVMVAKPMSSRKYLTAQRVKVFCALVLVVTLVLFAPTGLNVMWEVCYHDFNQNDICPNYAGVGWVLKYLYGLTIVYGPVLIIIYIISFFVIKINLTKANKEAESMMSSDVNAAEIQARAQQTVKITQILLAILICDCACVIPTCIQGVGLIIDPNGFVFNKTYVMANVIDVICEIFLCCRPTVNFAIYVCMHKEFRRQLELLFGKGRLWAQNALSDITNSSASGRGSGPNAKHAGDSRKGSLNTTQLTNVESYKLTPVSLRKEAIPIPELQRKGSIPNTEVPRKASLSDPEAPSNGHDPEVPSNSHDPDSQKPAEQHLVAEREDSVESDTLLNKGTQPANPV